MLTQCPSCQTIFRVTQDVLTVADGQVRCGRCGAAFDGIKGFVDHHQLLAARRSSSLLKGGTPPSTATSEHAATRPIRNAPSHLAPKPLLAKEAATEHGEPAAAQAVTPASAPPAPAAPDADTETTSVAAAAVTASPPEPTKSLATAAETPTPASQPVPPKADSASEDVAPEMVSTMELVLHRPKQRSWGAWKFIAPPLVALLCIQIVHYFRQDIASHPRFGPPLIALYGTFGAELAPKWRLRDYEVRQLGVLANPATPGTLKVRASITNRAPFAQPYPLLRLVLEDRFGQVVQAREFEPSEYADGTFGRSARLSPNQRLDANLTIVDPGTQAEGFRFDVCLRQASGVYCADDESPVL